MGVTEISCFGSCASRMIFNETFSKGYKKWFHINFSVEGQSLISLMSNPISFDSKLLNSENPFENKCVHSDLSKNFLNFLKKNSIDYLIIDTYFDVYNLYQLQNNSYITDTARLHNTDIFNTLNVSRKINPLVNFYEFFYLWKRACDLFFEFIKKNCDNVRVVLNPSRLVYKYKNSDGEILINSNFMEKSIKQNYIRDILETYLLINYDVEVLPFCENTLLDVNHIFGFAPTHYDHQYYPEKINQLREINQRTDFLNNIDGGNSFNEEFRRLRRENNILKFKRNISNFKNINDFKINFNILYDNISMGRFDLINKGNKSNSIEILSISDKNVIINFPEWFIRDDGTGIVIQSSKGNIDFKIKCIGDGMLNIILRGVHKYDSNKIRLPISSRYTRLSINDVDYLEGSKSVCHDTPLIINKSVSNSEVLNIHIEWSLYNNIFDNY